MISAPSKRTRTAKGKRVKRQKPITSLEGIEVEVIYIESEDAERRWDEAVRRIWEYGKRHNFFEKKH